MRVRPWIVLLVSLLGIVPATVVSSSPTVVFSTDFEGGIPAEFSAPGAVLSGVQGFAGLGPAGRQFGGNFLRYTSVPIHPTRLTVRNLPAHDRLSVRFLLGLIDSWDGTELMMISVDDSLRFSHYFQLATGDTTSYFPAPPGAILSMSADLGFSGCCYYHRDRAYDLGAEPAFLDIPHTADSVVVTWTLGAVAGPAAAQWQGGDDESWAIDAVSIEVSSQATDVTAEFARGRLAVAAIPNPARRGALRLECVLPVAAPATLDLLDVTGRRLVTRDLGGAAAGRHSIGLATGRDFAPGLYFARLTQGGVSRVGRVVVTD